MKTKINNPIIPVVHNNTPYTPEQIQEQPVVGRVTNKWRERNITLYEHPENPENVISVGKSFCGNKIVVAVEKRTAWNRAIYYFDLPRLHPDYGKISTNKVSITFDELWYLIECVRE